MLTYIKESIMLKVFVLVCSITNPIDCFALTDTTNLVKTNEDCYARIAEIAIAIRQFYPEYTISKFKCVNKGLKL